MDQDASDFTKYQRIFDASAALSLGEASEAVGWIDRVTMHPKLPSTDVFGGPGFDPSVSLKYFKMCLDEVLELGEAFSLGVQK